MRQKWQRRPCLAARKAIRYRYESRRHGPWKRYGMWFNRGKRAGACLLYTSGRRTALPRQSMPTKKAVPPQSKAQLKDRPCGACAVSRPPSPGGLLVLGRGQVSRLGILRRGAFPFRVEQWPCPLVRFTVTGIVRKSHPVPLTRAHPAARRTNGTAASAYSSVKRYYSCLLYTSRCV